MDAEDGDIATGFANALFANALSACKIKPEHKLAIAFSGGGDSMALLALAANWVSNTKQIHAFIIDHDLRHGSQSEAKRALSRAETLGVRAQILQCHWPDNRPKTAIQEKARIARYRLLAEACDKLGVENLPLLLGHTFDDQLETVYMRRGGKDWRGLAGMALCAPLPVVPSIYNIKAVRPLLGFRRKQLRKWNKRQGLKWIEDPSNENTDFTRIRARQTLQERPELKPVLMAQNQAAKEVLAAEKLVLKELIEQNVKAHLWGGLELSEPFLQSRVGQISEALRYILAAFWTATNITPSQRLRLASKLKTTDFKGATLGGVHFVPASRRVLCVRDLGVLTGRHQKPALADMMIKSGRLLVWDKRFILKSTAGGLIKPLATCYDMLSPKQKNQLGQLSLIVRQALPALITKDGNLVLPTGVGLAVRSGFSAQSVIGKRLETVLA